MRSASLRAAARAVSVALMGLTLLAASPGSVAAVSRSGDLDGPGFSQQVPAPGGGAPVQHIPGNAGTGDASSPSGKSKPSKPSKAGGQGDQTGNDSVDSVENGCGSDNSGGSDDSDDGDEGPCATASPTPTATPTPTPTPTATPAATPTPTPTPTAAPLSVVRTEIIDVVNNGTQFKVVQVFRDNELLHEVFIRVSSPSTGVTSTTETTTVNGQVVRIVRVFTDGQPTHVVQVPQTGPATLGNVLGFQQAPAGTGSTVTNPLTAPGQNGAGPTDVAGQQSAGEALGISSLPSTTPVVPAAPLGGLGVLIVAGGAWLLSRSRKQ